MKPTLDGLISKAEKLARSGDGEGAMLMADDLLKRNPDNVKVLSLRGYLHERNRDYGRAISDLSRAIDLDPMEPALLFNRGRYYLKAQQYESAADDFSRGLTLCDQRNDDYYRGAFYFLRAEVFVQLGMKLKR